MTSVQSVKIGTKEYKSGTTVTLPAYPTTLPASDVKAWAKAATKPTYTKAEVGLGNVDNTSDANKSVKHATSSDTATQLSSSAGSTTQPVYFSGGKPVACSYTLGKSVPSNAVFTDTNTWIALKGATASAAGTAGYVPAPSAGAANRYLRSDGTWSVPPNDNTTYSLGSFGITATAAEINYTKGVTSSIQTQLNGKASSSHTHNYAGSSSAGGAANSAVKLFTARTISLSGLSSGSASFDGSGNVTITNNGYGVAKYVTNADIKTPYYRIAYAESKASYDDLSMVFVIDSGYVGGGFGIVKVCLRNDNITSANQSHCDVQWLVRQGFAADQLIVKGNAPANTTQYADLYFKANATYSAINVRVINTGARGTNARKWTFDSGSTASRAAADIRTYSYTTNGLDVGIVSYAASAGSANSVAWKNVSSKPAIVGKTVRTLTGVGTSGWKDVLTDQGYIPDMAFIAYWNGAYSGTTSNLAYCNKGAFGTAATKSTGDFAAASHSHSQYYDAAITRTANTVLAAPNGSNGKASFRKLVAADIPSLTKSKISDFSHTHDDRYYTETEINTKLKNKILPQSTEPTSQSEGDYWLKTTTL